MSEPPPCKRQRIDDTANDMVWDMSQRRNVMPGVDYLSTLPEDMLVEIAIRLEYYWALRVLCMTCHALNTAFPCIKGRTPPFTFHYGWIRYVGSKYGSRALIEWGGPWSHYHNRPELTWDLASVGRVDDLRLAIENGVPWHRYTLSRAASSKSIETMAYCLTVSQSEFGEDINDVVPIAAGNNDIAMIEYLLEKGGCLTTSTVQHVAAYGNLDTLQWLHEHGCPWYKFTLETLANRCEMAMFEYALTHGCLPGDDPTIMMHYALRSRNPLPCITYLYEHGYTANEYVYRHAKKEGHENVTAYLRDRGLCPEQ